MAEARDFKYCTVDRHVGITSLKWAWSGSREFSKFWEISDNILETV